jgi:myo-inositol 2-dehydrogenase/D-chiro-inositol 1-dehydrogenase
MRLGFAGTGSMAVEHARAATALGHTVTGCYSTNRSKADGFAAAFGGRVFEDADQLISQRHIDALFIAVPPYAHDGRLERAAIRNRVPVMIEKPIGLDLDVCRSIAAEVKSAGIVTSVGYLLRESPLIPEIRTLIARNRLASVRSCRVSAFSPQRWWRKMSESGGMMVEEATHQIDLMRFVFGEIRSVSAVTSAGIGVDRWEGCDVYDSMEALLAFDGGLVGSIGITNVLPEDSNRVDLLEVFGSDLYLSLDFDRVRYKEGSSDWVEIPSPSLDSLLRAEDARFLDAASRRAPADVTCTYSDALETLKVTLAMNEAARRRRWVDVR